MEQKLENLINKIRRYDTKSDLNIVKKAFDFAFFVHKDQYRLSGEPFISHPLAVAEILADLEQDVTTIVAALLHDTIEDGNVSEEKIRQDYGQKVLDLVLGVTKLGKLNFETKEEHQAENFRKMFIAMAQDLRIILIKLADRLHNMKTLEFLPKEKQIDISKETMEIYAPLAHRLGMWRLKWELEDLAFYYLQPEEYKRIKNLVAEKKEERERFIENFISEVKNALANFGINCQIYGRSKHFYSIYNKIVKKKVDFEDIYDLMAIRIIVDTVKDCYSVLGIVHSIWKPVPGRFRDFIALPKPNGYQTLHTTVLAENGRPVEIQIRTKQMHKTAEYGIAAHWKYKEGFSSDDNFDRKMSWIREMIDYQKEIKDAKEFLDNIKIDFFMDEVFVYSPKGDVYELPIGSTPIDFAYRVHTQIGHRCVGAKVNGKIVPLDYQLKNGDIVQIITSSKESPKLDWLKFIRTSGAKTKIKQWFKKQKRDENIERGKKLFQLEFEKITPNFNESFSKISTKLLQNLNFQSLDDFFAAIGVGEINLSHLLKTTKKLLVEEGIIPSELENFEVKTVPQKPKEKIGGLKVVGMENILTRLSKCCYPIPGDEVVGFVTKGRGVSVHRIDCLNITNCKEKQTNLIPIEWNKSSGQTYPAGIEIEAFDRVGLIKDIMSQISESHTNINSAEVKTVKGSKAIINVVVDVVDTEHLKNVINSIRKVSDVINVFRTTSNSKFSDKGVT